MKTRAMKTCCWVLLVLLAIETTGCSFFGPKRQTISVMSDPMGAQVIVNGENAGQTPLQYSVRRNQESAIIVRKEGYQAAQRQLNEGLSTFGILDLIGGCVWLVPFFGLLAPGAWEQDPANISVVLTPNSQAN